MVGLHGRAVGRRIEAYMHGKGTIRFPADEPIPADLVRKIVAVRLEEMRSELGSGSRAGVPG